MDSVHKIAVDSLRAEATRIQMERDEAIADRDALRAEVARLREDVSILSRRVTGVKIMLRNTESQRDALRAELRERAEVNDVDYRALDYWHRAGQAESRRAAAECARANIAESERDALRAVVREQANALESCSDWFNWPELVAVRNALRNATFGEPK